MGHVRIWGSPGLATTQGHPARRSILNHKYLCKRLLSTEASLPRGSNERGKDAPESLPAVGGYARLKPVSFSGCYFSLLRFSDSLSRAISAR